MNPRHPIHILVPEESLFFFSFFDGVMCTYTYKKENGASKNG